MLVAFQVEEVPLNTSLDKLESSIVSVHFDAKNIFNLTGENVAGSTSSEPTNQRVSEVDSNESKF